MKRLIYTFALLFVTLSMMAATITGGTVLYLKPNSNWKESNARFAAYFFGNGEAWVDMKHIGDDVYVCVSPNKSYSKVIFCRMNPSASANNWNNKWNQSGNLIWDGSKNLFTVPSGWWDGATTGWSAYTCSWTLAGEPATLFGETWLPGKSENNLVYENNGIWTKTYPKASLNKGDIKFKVCKDYSWNTSFPASDKIFNIAKDGIYNVTFTFDYKDLSISVVTEEVIEPTIAITNADVAYIEDSFSIGFESNIDNPSVSYFVKVPGANGYSKINSADYKFNVVGKYRFKVEFTHDGDVVSAEKDIEVKYSAFVAGTKALCDSEWSESDEANKMEKVDGVFKKTYTNVPAGTHKFKIVYKGNWLGHYNRFSSEYSSTCTNDNDDNIQFTLGNTATVIISYNKSTDKIELKVVYDNFEVGEKIYFSSDKGGSVYAAYLFGESGETWVNLSQEYANIYSATIPDGNWGGVIFCSMKSETLDRTNINSKTKYLEYEGKNWYKWTNESEWRNFENLIYAKQKLYFKPDSNWESANARFAAYYWDVLDETNQWANCVYDSVDHAYHVVAPTVGEGVNRVVWTNIKFVRMKPNSENNWDNDWNKTPDLVYDGANDFFIIKLTGKDWDSADPNNWISFSHPFEGAIFFEPNASLKATAKKRFSIYLWNGFDENCWAKMQPMATHPDIYCVVIPEGYWTGANICSMNPATDGDSFEKKNDKYIDLLNQTDNLTYHSDKLLYKAPDEWDFMVPADEYWMEFESNIEDKNLVGDVASGVYFQVFKYNKTISGEDVNKWHWISLPYNVKISEIEGGVFGTDFIIQEYDTEARAKWENNIAAENKSAWRMMEVGETLLAGKGYILAVNNEKSSYTLTFVSETDLNVVADEFDGNNINYSFNVAESANWHLIGTGLYGAANSFGGVDYVAVPQGDDYLYYNLSTDGLANINAYGAFFVQHTGDYSFSKAQPAQNAAPRRARAEEMVEHYYVNIVGMADTSHTAIFLAEDGSDDYVVGKDFLHLGASGASLQLYTLQGESTLSFNYLKREDRMVLVGGYVAQSGKYTISLDAEGDASSVTLYDMQTGLVADLLNENYEFEAEKGILDGRFSVIISYAKGDGPATEVENDMTMGVVVVNCDGIARFEGLSIGESVVVYDVVGRCVTQFVAESDKADVMLTSGVYVLYHNGETVKFVVNR